jgi:hypothetical protein
MHGCFILWSIFYYYINNRTLWSQLFQFNSYICATCSHLFVCLFVCFEGLLNFEHCKIFHTSFTFLHTQLQNHIIPRILDSFYWRIIFGDQAQGAMCAHWLQSAVSLLLVIFSNMLEAGNRFLCINTCIHTYLYLFICLSVIYPSVIYLSTYTWGRIDKWGDREIKINLKLLKRSDSGNKWEPGTEAANSKLSFRC